MRWLLATLVALVPTASLADTAGKFDYYVLSLSWSPNWCALEGDARNSDQCDARHDFGWILHGLWPQYTRGFPDYCQTAQAPPNRRATREMTDIMASSGLAWHQWKKHGTCSGLSPAAYYNLSREAYDAVTRPAILRRLNKPVRIAPSVIEGAFLQDNPQLKPDQVTVTCRSDHIQEVRICLSKSLVPRTCGSDVIRDCSVSSALFTPVR
ncbi:MAG: ribonuclease T [Roseobacter sp.]